MKQNNFSLRFFNDLFVFKINFQLKQNVQPWFNGYGT